MQGGGSGSPVRYVQNPQGGAEGRVGQGATKNIRVNTLIYKRAAEMRQEPSPPSPHCQPITMLLCLS